MTAAPKMTEVDVKFVLAELAAWQRGERGTKLTWHAIARTSGFSRQALFARKDVAKAFNDAKSTLRGDKPRKRGASEEILEAKIRQLKEKVASLEAQDGRWVVKFAQITYHLRMRNLSIDQFDQPLPENGRR